MFSLQEKKRNYKITNLNWTASRLIYEGERGRDKWMAAVMGGETRQNDWVDRGGRENEKSFSSVKVLDFSSTRRPHLFFAFFLPFHLFLYILAFLFLYVRKRHCVICLRNSLWGLACCVLWKIERCVCLWGREIRGDGESERNGESAQATPQHLAVSNYPCFCLQCSMSQKIPAQSCPDMIPLPFSVIIAISTAATLTITYASWWNCRVFQFTESFSHSTALSKFTFIYFYCSLPLIPKYINCRTLLLILI